MMKNLIRTSAFSLTEKINILTEMINKNEIKICHDISSLSVGRSERQFVGLMDSLQSIIGGVKNLVKFNIQ